MMNQYRLFGDRGKAIGLRGLADQHMATTLRLMEFQDLKQWSRITEYADGTVIQSVVMFGQKILNIFVPPPIPEEGEEVEEKVPQRFFINLASGQQFLLLFYDNSTFLEVIETTGQTSLAPWVRSLTATDGSRVLVTKLGIYSEDGAQLYSPTGTLGSCVKFLTDGSKVLFEQQLDGYWDIGLFCKYDMVEAVSKDTVNILAERIAVNEQEWSYYPSGRFTRIWVGRFRDLAKNSGAAWVPGYWFSGRIRSEVYSDTYWSLSSTSYSYDECPLCAESLTFGGQEGAEEDWSNDDIAMMGDLSLAVSPGVGKIMSFSGGRITAVGTMEEFYWDVSSEPPEFSCYNRATISEINYGDLDAMYRRHYGPSPWKLEFSVDELGRPSDYLSATNNFPITFPVPSDEGTRAEIIGQCECVLSESAQENSADHCVLATHGCIDPYNTDEHRMIPFDRWGYSLSEAWVRERKNFIRNLGSHAFGIQAEGCSNPISLSTSFDRHSYWFFDSEDCSGEPDCEEKEIPPGCGHYWNRAHQSSRIVNAETPYCEVIGGFILVSGVVKSCVHRETPFEYTKEEDQFPIGSSCSVSSDPDYCLACQEGYGYAFFEGPDPYEDMGYNAGPPYPSYTQTVPVVPTSRSTNLSLTPLIPEATEIPVRQSEALKFVHCVDVPAISGEGETDVRAYYLDDRGSTWSAGYMAAAVIDGVWQIYHNGIDVKALILGTLGIEEEDIVDFGMV